MFLKKIILFFIFCLIATPALGEVNPFEQLFQEGIKTYQNQKYKESRELFSKALEISPYDPNVMTNLGLTEYQLGHTGLAIGLWRKALALKPGYITANSALNFALKKLEVKELPHKIEYWEKFRSIFLTNLSIEMLLAICAFLLITSGWLLLKYFGTRKNAYIDELPLPKFPLLATVVTFILFTCVLLTSLKFVDYLNPRGTIITKKVSAYAGPADTQPILFELFEGLEVIILKLDGNWVQVNYPGGPTAWIIKSDIFPTTGRNLW